MDQLTFLLKTGVKIVNEIPAGWGRIIGATTAPNGYVWINNKKSCFSDEYEHALLRI